MPKGVIPRSAFKKGVSANPKGRPPGILSPQRRKFMEIQKRCADDFDAIYSEIREKMKEGEAWAYQLYVKEFLPKKALEPRLLINTKEGESRIESLMRALSQLTELTHDEVLDEIKTLSMKSNEVELLGQHRIERDSDDQLMRKVMALRSVIEENENENKENK